MLPEAYSNNSVKKNPDLHGKSKKITKMAMIFNKPDRQFRIKKHLVRGAISTKFHDMFDKHIRK